jgi:hypothetical protein
MIRVNARLILAFLICMSAPQAFASSYLLGDHPVTVVAEAQSPRVRESLEVGAGLGYEQLQTSWGGVAAQPTGYILLNDEHNSVVVSRFLRALMKEKPKLMTLYRLSDANYNRFAVMSFAIFGVETKFGSSRKYKFKERHQALVTWLKTLRTGEPADERDNSRGGTQIKNIPDRIARVYPEITEATLVQPENSAIATLGFLAETFEMLKDRRDRQAIIGLRVGHVDFSFLSDDAIYDYIPYVYSGQMKKVLRGPNGPDGASVTDNIYVNHMREFVRELVVIEAPVVYQNVHTF